LQASGLEPGEQPARSVEQMASDYIREIRQAQPSGPYHLAGWSFGGLIAYEIAARLQAMGEEVALLALLDTALQQPDDDDDITDASIIETLIDVLGLEKVLPGATQAITDLDSFVAAARLSGLWPADFSAAQAAAILALFKLNVVQANSYVPGLYRGDVVLFRAMATPGDNDRYFDWSRLVDGDLTTVRLACTHNQVPFEPNTAEIARVLRPRLKLRRAKLR
jgi:thioesterase domain-containing protein